MATVYKAKCLVLNRYVAVKILRDEFTTDEEFIKRFNIEAQAAASLTHPNIVSVYDVGNEGTLYYIVMELVKGKTLKEIIVEDGALGWKWSVKVAMQIASALEMAHKNNIIHRDIKPHNIIITEDVRKDLHNEYNLRYLDNVVVKGKSEPVKIYEKPDERIWLFGK